MQVSAEAIEQLIHYQELDATLPDDGRPQDTPELVDFLYRLKKDAKHEGKQAFDRWVNKSHPDTYPWSGVRTVEVGEPDTGWQVERRMSKGPPGLFLVLERDPDLEPLRPGDEIADYRVNDPKWASLWKALFSWDVP
ncbi:MAG: hypothetical protein ACPG4T_11035, partial [Nannocystaceae bacterium]